MSVAIFTPTPYINKWQMSLCNNSSDNKSYWIHRVDVKVSAQVTTVTYMHQSQPSLHSFHINFTVHLELWPGNHLIWCNATWTLTTAKSHATKLPRGHTILVWHTWEMKKGGRRGIHFMGGGGVGGIQSKNEIKRISPTSWCERGSMC